MCVSRLATALSRRLSPSSSSRAQRQRRQHSAHAATTSGRDESDSAAPGSVGTSEDADDRRGRHPPPLRTYYADWAEVILPDKHRFPMEKYRATRLALEADRSLAGKLELVPSPVRVSKKGGGAVGNTF